MDRNTKMEMAKAITGYPAHQSEHLWEALQAAGSGIEVCNDRSIPQGNKALAVMGDKLLAFFIIRESYDRESSIGDMSKLVDTVTSNDNLARACDDSGLTKCINGNPSQDGRVFPRTKSATVEAVIASAYLDGGEAAAKTVMRHLRLL
ncbi:ribonuclease III domain-containing protein [Xylariomycetidae sp. FL2044]|nr:ribonuclease III domain-containing protein [Xylariomycetidae sp. FL2044]